jgi:hypothetical protein
MTDTRCGAVLTPAEIVPECAALCDAKLARDASCQGAHVNVVVYSSSKPGAGEKLKATLNRRLETLLTAEAGMKAPAERAVSGFVQALQAVDEAVASPAASDEALSSCLNAAREQRDRAQTALTQVREASMAVFAALKN